MATRIVAANRTDRGTNMKQRILGRLGLATLVSLASVASGCALGFVTTVPAFDANALPDGGDGGDVAGREDVLSDAVESNADAREDAAQDIDAAVDADAALDADAIGDADAAPELDIALDADVELDTPDGGDVGSGVASKVPIGALTIGGAAIASTGTMLWLTAPRDRDTQRVSLVPDWRPGFVGATVGFR